MGKDIIKNISIFLLLIFIFFLNINNIFSNDIKLEKARNRNATTNKYYYDDGGVLIEKNFFLILILILIILGLTIISDKEKN